MKESPIVTDLEKDLTWLAKHKDLKSWALVAEKIASARDHISAELWDEINSLKRTIMTKVRRETTPYSRKFKPGDIVVDLDGSLATTVKHTGANGYVYTEGLSGFAPRTAKERLRHVD